MQRTVQFMDIEDELVAMIINKLTVRNQVSLSRVSKRLHQQSFIKTTHLNVEDIPDDRRVDIVNKLPNLIVVSGIGCENVNFVKWLATINPNITKLIGKKGRHVTEIRSLCFEYLLIVKKLNPDFNGDHFQTLLDADDYLRIKNLHLDLDVKCIQHFICSSLTNYVKSVDNFSIYNQISSLIVSINWERGNFYQLFQVLEQISNQNFPLKSLTLKILSPPSRLTKLDAERLGVRVYHGVLDVYTWTPTDYESLQKILNIETLKSVDLDLLCQWDVKSMINCLINSSNNHLNSFKLLYRHPYDGDRYVINTCVSMNGNICHTINYCEETFENHSIIDLIQKFKRRKNFHRSFGLSRINGRQWTECLKICEQFAKDNLSYKFSLFRDSDSGHEFTFN